MKLTEKWFYATFIMFIITICLFFSFKPKLALVSFIIFMFCAVCYKVCKSEDKPFEVKFNDY